MNIESWDAKDFLSIERFDNIQMYNLNVKKLHAKLKGN